MAILGQKAALHPDDLAELSETAGVRGFGGEFDSAYFVKAVALDPATHLAEAKTARQRLLESGRIQQQLIDSGARHWAPILRFGNGPRGPYFVASYYRLTAAQLIGRKTHLSRRSLHRIASAVVKGLREIKDLRGRPHGNLKASNVLLTGDPEAKGTRIVLSDPAPADDLVRQTQGSNDLYELGQLIHQLVLHKKFTGAWPIPASAEWSRLGTKAASWRGLCNQLLHPNPEKRLTRLRSAAAEVRALRPGRLTLSSPAAIAALVIAIGGAGAWMVMKDPMNLRRGGTPQAMRQAPAKIATDTPRAVVLGDVRPPAPGEAQPTTRQADVTETVTSAPAEEAPPEPMSEPDPRTRWDFAARLAAVRQQGIERLASLRQPGASGPDAEAQALQQRFDEIGQQAASMAKLPWDRENQEKIAAAMTQVDEALKSAQQDVDQAVASRQQQARDAMARAQEAEAERQKQAMDAMARAEQAEQDRRQAEAKKKEAERLAVALSATKVSDEAIVQKEWESRIAPILAELRSDPPRHDAQTQVRADALRELMVALDGAVAALKKDATVAPPQAPWGADAAAAVLEIERQRQTELINAAVAATRGQTTAEAPRKQWDALTADRDRRQASAQKLLGELARVEALLEAGYALDEKPTPDTASPGQLVSEARRSELLKEARIQAALRPLLDPIGALESSDWQGALKVAASEQNRLGLRISAWLKVGARSDVPWPKEAGDLRQSLSIAENLNAAVERVVQDEQRRGRLRTMLEQHGRTLWAQFMEQSSTAGDVEFALSIREGVLGSASAPLGPRATFNIRLDELRKALGAEGASPAALAQPIERLRAAATALPENQRSGPPVAPLLGALDQWNKGALTPPDFSKLGPMTPGSVTASSLPWTVAHDPQTDAVTYKAKVPPEISSEEVVLVFRRVATEPGTPPAYLCISETSFGLFSDVVTAMGKWPQISQLLWRYDPGEGDPRAGPRIWEWPRYGSMSRGVKRTIYWLAGNSDHYPLELSTRENRMVLKDSTGRASRDLNPAKRHPMQYVSPAAAMAFAEIVGCRLMTPAEWKSAYRAPEAQAKVKANLRDRTWGVQYRWAYASRGSEPYGPDAGIFMPAGERRSPELWSDSAGGAARGDARARAYSDDILWFDQVGAAEPVFYHLAGNVAEMAAQDGRVFVIGASALSPPAPARAIDREYEIAEWQSSRGWSDVGFRLAFSTPGASPEQLRQLIAAQPFLLAQKQ